jgi:hypothetical protein
MVGRSSRSGFTHRRDHAASALGLGLAALLACAPIAPLAAQVIRGIVTDRANNSPVSGVLMSVLDGRDSLVVQTLTDEQGAFELRLPAAGNFSIDVKRIGVRRSRVPSFTVGEGQTHRMDISVEPLPAVLSSVRITGRTACVRRPDMNAKTAALWEDARAALNAAVISRTLRAGNDTVVRFMRKLDVDTWRVLYEDRRRVSAVVDRPFRSLPAEELSFHGYVRTNTDGSVDYFAPDADVLLSQAFLDDHCFRLTPGWGERVGHVGLAFEPAPGRKVPDIKGTLWMDAKTSELRVVDFEYTWLPNEHRLGDFGGTVSFFRMPGGRWIVRNWRIRMPEFGYERTVLRPDGTRMGLGRSTKPQLVRISEEGGMVPLDVLLNQAGRVRGSVRMGANADQPVAGMTVALSGTADSTMTAADGSFELAFVQPGSYSLVLRHPALDSLGVIHLGRSIEVNPGLSPPLDLRFPSYEELAAQMCADPVDFTRAAVIRFFVVDISSGSSLANAPAILSRVPLDADGKAIADSAASYDVTLDARGSFLGCALRADEIVRLESPPEAPVPWAETIRPRAGIIGWHVVRMRVPKRQP